MVVDILKFVQMRYIVCGSCFGQHYAYTIFFPQIARCIRSLSLLETILFDEYVILSLPDTSCFEFSVIRMWLYGYGTFLYMFLSERAH